MLPKLDIIIVNWNTGLCLRHCLESIAASDADGFTLARIVVVDNASEDGSADGMNDLNLPLSVIRNGMNRGFAAACNQGARGSNADYLLFLNPDTRLFSDSLFKVLTFMEAAENKHIGITGIQLLDDRGTIARSCARFPTPGKILYEMAALDRLFPRFFRGHFMVEWDHRASREVDQVMGAFFLVRCSLFERLGGFDERFFVYYEDVDFSFRARQAGFRTFYFSEARAYHKGKASSDLDKAARLFYVLRSRILYVYKHFSWLAATGVLLGTLLIEPIFRLGLTIMQRSWQAMYETAKGYARLWREVPTLLMRSGGGQ